MKWVRKEALAGATLGGAWLNLGSSITAEIAGNAGYRWLLIDMEHGAGDYKDLLLQLQALSSFDVAPIVRVPAIDPVVFKQVLDQGPSGVMIPNVANAADAQRLLSYVRIPPLGKRGAAQTTRASGYGGGYQRYLDEANQNILVVAQIESREGVDNLDEIAAIDGIDVLFVGPTDLSIDFGLSSDPNDPAFKAVLLKVAAAAKRHGKSAGVLVRNQQQARDYAAMGYRFIALGSDRSMVISGMNANAKFFGELASDLA